MKSLLFFAVLLLAAVLMPSTLSAQAPGCQPADCARICSSATGSTATAVKPTTTAAHQQSEQTSQLVNLLLPPAPSCLKKAVKPVTQTAGTDCCQPACCDHKAAMTTAKPTDKKEEKSRKM